jgi:hypothetical protein
MCALLSEKQLRSSAWLAISPSSSPDPRIYARWPLEDPEHSGGNAARRSEWAMTIEEATDADIFLGYVEQVLCPTLAIGDVVVMDNLS